MFDTNPYGVPKPNPPIKLSMPKSSELYLHPGENETGFKWVMERINFLSAMSKFFPEFENEIYYMGGASEESTKEYGDANAPFTVDGQTNDPFDGTGGVLYNPEGFGAFHRQLRNGSLWGAGMGEQARKTLWNYDSKNKDQTTRCSMAAGNFGDTGPLSVDEYKASTTDTGTNYSDYSGIWSEVEDYMKSFGDQSYYDIMMNGLKDKDMSPYIINLGNNSEDIDWTALSGVRATTAGWGEYAGKAGSDGKGAFLFMIAMLEDRRRIIKAMSDFFTPTKLIASQNGMPDDQAIINHMDSWLNDPSKGKGVFSGNLEILGMFLGSQHSYHEISTALTGGYNGDLGYGRMNGGENGGPLGVKDQIGTYYFRNWIRPAAATYVNSLSGSQKDWAQNLYNEFTYQIGNQPYGGSWNDVAQYTGWDFYAAGVDSFPPNQNPFVKDDYWHKNMLLAQITGMSRGQEMGSGTLDGVNYYNSNWGVHAIGMVDGFHQQYSSYVTSRMMRMRMDQTRYTKDMMMYKQKIAEKKDDEYVEQTGMARAQARRNAEKKQMEQKAKAKSEAGRNNKGKNVNGDKTSKQIQEEIKKSMQRKYFAKQIGRLKEAQRKKED
ncbi:MAG: hypothetical protein WC624_04975 [Candidatus Margulisiibacteriota bacterium]